MYQRILEQTLIKDLSKQKVAILLGARRVGKTSLLRKIFENQAVKKLWLNGEDADTRKILENRSISNFKNLLQDAKLLIIDEAQHIPEIGEVVKLMIDEIIPLHIIITGSSAFDLAQSGYPLVGRNISRQLFPLAQAEFALEENLLETRQQLEQRLLYGSYPEVSLLETAAGKQQYLRELVNTYLLKDILEFENIKNAAILKKLLELIAWQAGSEVSENELANTLGISKNTVSRYLDLLEKVFIIYPLTAYSNNLRKEISKGKKWFFYDTGVRNAIIQNFSPLALRQDAGQLWENYCISERKKINSYKQVPVQSFFWRTYDQQEIDLIEVNNGSLHAFEIKSNDGKSKLPVAFANAYPAAEFSVINQANYLEWIS
ncbi:MAG: ATP-binding protein [Chitinophagaceae bacterium]|nr:MAG: ATP-binding protein [Chitinophagaceae bacterium]